MSLKIFRAPPPWLRTWLRRSAAAMIAISAAAVAALVLLSTSSSGDYRAGGGVAGDNAAPALAALAHGDLGGFLARQPVMGPVSLLLRAPVQALADELRASPLTAYRLGALACLLPMAALAAWLVLDARRRRRGAPAAVIAGILMLAGPVTLQALLAGHPEEVLASTLATAAVLAAERERALGAGLLLGGAIATKGWALIALVPVLLALRDDPRRRRGYLAGALAASLALVPMVADPSAFTAAERTFGGGELVSAFSGWWPLAGHSAASAGLAPLAGALPLGLTKSGALGLALVAAAGAEVLVAWASTRRGRAIHPLALVTVGALVRCLLDPAPVEYYFVSLLVPLAGWEIVARNRPPILALLLTAGLWAIFGPAVSALSPAWLNLVVWAGALGLAAGMTRSSVPRPLRRNPPRLKGLRPAPINASCDA